MCFEIILVFILFKKTNKKNSSQTPNIYGIRVVQKKKHLFECIADSLQLFVKSTRNSWENDKVVHT